MKWTEMKRHNDGGEAWRVRLSGEMFLSDQGIDIDFGDMPVFHDSHDLPIQGDALHWYRSGTVRMQVYWSDDKVRSAAIFADKE